MCASSLLGRFAVPTGSVTEFSKDLKVNIFSFEPKNLRQFRRIDWSIISDVSKDRFAFTDLPEPAICPLRFFQNASISLPVNMMIYPGNIATRNSKLAIILPCNPLPMYLQERTLEKLRNYQLKKKNCTP